MIFELTPRRRERKSMKILDGRASQAGREGRGLKLEGSSRSKGQQRGCCEGSIAAKRGVDMNHDVSRWPQDRFVGS